MKKNEYTFREMWDIIRHANIHKKGVPEGECKKEKN